MSAVCRGMCHPPLSLDWLVSSVFFLVLLCVGCAADSFCTSFHCVSNSTISEQYIYPRKSFGTLRWLNATNANYAVHPTLAAHAARQLIENRLYVWLAQQRAEVQYRDGTVAGWKERSELAVLIVRPSSA